MQELAKNNQNKQNPFFGAQNSEFAKIHLRLEKYLDRMTEMVQLKGKKFVNKREEDIFNEIDKVLACQLLLDEPQFRKESEMKGLVITSIPIIDIILNINLFTVQFEDRNKILLVIKALYNNCNNMKRLLLNHHKLILTNLMDKYDKKCHLYYNQPDNKSTDVNSSIHENRDEFLAVNIGQLIRLYTKSKTLSKAFCDFQILDRLASLMQHE
jgi:hypothetical protein